MADSWIHYGEVLSLNSEELALNSQGYVLDLNHYFLLLKNSIPHLVPALSWLIQPDDFDLEKLSMIAIVLILYNSLYLVHVGALGNLFWIGEHAGVNHFDVHLKNLLQWHFLVNPHSPVFLVCLEEKEEGDVDLWLLICSLTLKNVAGETIHELDVEVLD